MNPVLKCNSFGDARERVATTADDVLSAGALTFQEKLQNAQTNELTIPRCSSSSQFATFTYYILNLRCLWAVVVNLISIINILHFHYFVFLARI